MKKKLFINFMAAVTVFAMPCITSCSDDSGDGGGGGKDTITFTEAKQLFETNGLNVVDALADMENEEGMVAMASLNAVMPMMQNSYVAGSFSALAMQEPSSNPFYMFYQLMDMRGANESLGTYTYNKEAKNFSFISDATKPQMILKFPASKTASTNTGTATLSYTTYLLDELPIPQTISAVIKVGSKNVMTASMALAYEKYDTLTLPKSFALNFGMGKFASAFELKDQLPKSTAEYYISVSSDKVISIAASAVGVTMSNGLNGQQTITNTKAVELTGILGELSIVGGVADGPAFINAIDSMSVVSNEAQNQYYADAAARDAALRPIAESQAAYVNQFLSIKLMSGKNLIATFHADANDNLDEGWMATNALFADGTKTSIEEFGQSQEMGNIMARATEVIKALKASFKENTPDIE